MALTNFNRYDTILRILDYANNDDRITEIIISDDGSKNSIKEKLKKLQSGKVKVFFSQRNFGPFKNKTLAIQKATNEWVFLFDSDDMIDENYLDALEKEQPLMSEIVYCPVYGYTTRFGKISSDDNWDYSLWQDKLIDIDFVREVFKNGKTDFGAFLNTSAYIINKEKYLECALPYINTVFYNDSIHFKYIWLKKGFMCKIVPSMYYFHSYDEKQSFYKIFRTKNELCTKEIIKSIVNNTSYNFDFSKKIL